MSDTMLDPIDDEQDDCVGTMVDTSWRIYGKTSLIPRIGQACGSALLPNWWHCCRQASLVDALIEVEEVTELEQRQIVGELPWASVLRVKHGLCYTACLSPHVFDLLWRHV